MEQVIFKKDAASISVMPNEQILKIMPMAGDFSQWEKECFCGGVRRCAQYLLNTKGKSETK